MPSFWVPAFYIQKVAFTYNSQPLMHIDFGVAEDPHVRFFFVPDGPGIIEVKADDNEGKSFTHTEEIRI